MECVRGLGTVVVGGEVLYKVSVGGMNAISPPRQWVLNKMFPEDRTKIWTESKVAHALHNRAMGNPHDKIYQMQDVVNKHALTGQIQTEVPRKD